MSIKKFSHISLTFAIFLVIVNFFLIKFPLTKVIGYEYSFINSIFLFLFSGIIIIYKNNQLKIFEYSKLINKTKYDLLLLNFPPLLMGVLSTIFFSKCPFGKDIIFYFIITIPAAFFGTSLAFFITTVFKKFNYMLFLIFFLSILLVSLIEFYFNPQVYFYNPIFGYLGGTIYDEEIPISNVLLSYRLFNLSFFICLIFVSEQTQKKVIKKGYVILILIFVVILFFFLKPIFHFSTTFNSLTKYLNTKIESKNVTIYISPKINSIKDLELLKLLHEYYYTEVKNKLNLEDNTPIISFVFYNEDEKALLLGTREADISKPWLSQIYLSFPTYSQTLKHEIVHSLSSQFGKTIFNVTPNFNPAIIEGLAMAIEDEFDIYPIHYAAKIAFDFKYKIELKELFNTFNFFTNYSSLSYVYAGSFIKFLIDKYGIEQIKQFYSKPDFEGIFKCSLEELEKEYYSFLKSIDIKSNKNQAQLYYGGKTLFRKYCPRVAAHEIRKALKYYKEHKYYLAEKYFSKVYSYSESYESLSGLINCLLAQSKTLQAEKILTNEIKKFSSSNYYYALELMLADVYVRNKKYWLAKNLLDSIITQNPHIEYVNQSHLRKEILIKQPEELVNYYKMKDEEKINFLINLNKNIIHYFSIPVIINLCKNNHMLLKNVVEFFRGKIVVNDFNSCYAAYKLSIASLSLGEYELSREYAIKSLNFEADKTFSIILKRNFNKVNWITKSLSNN